MTVDDRFRVRESGAAGPVPPGYTVTSVPEGVRVEAPDGGRLLYARSGPGLLPGGPPADDLPPGASAYTSASDQQVDMVIVDAARRPEVIGELRRSGVIGVTTAVVAVGGDHRVPSPREFARRARLWGALVPGDGTVMTCPPSVWPDPRPRGPHRTLVTGGARSGKSTEAELRLMAEPKVVYAATGPAPDADTDPEWAERVALHIGRRPWWWRTEQTTDLATVLRGERGAVLVDCLGTWLTSVMDESGLWEEDAGRDAEEYVETKVRELLEAWRSTRAYVVAVTNEVGSGVVPSTRAGRIFRDRLGLLNQWVGAESEEVVLATAGRVLELE
ncbi:bifunctional adenosylcobinamide kinase/adenosylcobinamide-phosphate guanylyltransferase [Nocardiopsis sp. MG754419]|uniref:bifunctional adenosylcobinamide kinase/adenosylcobinamide-phosphate guanylyltransferase n=1 Tax=Nocardiopsis sp. MG754419 TaxID=2259865 RepID=UPI001BA51DAA|nr:bifunctional adenosylcobinamide kinase/adenosylcobinamide-phosphate guanylyltransferase [Nocardiopsis sp. MG754419]MBR8744407.1 bifunctional adenosylcobinamide kinase/adenosylcobinamide-phosphate guanylyltransferase [Nocardiopsis sp. MG754419]